MPTSRRIPHDRLPALGAWEGPIYGELGVLESDGETLQCHACGRRFRFLGGHVHQAHGLSAEEYRAVFGLMAQTPLASPDVRATRRERAEATLRPYRERAGEMGRSGTPEEHAARQRGIPWRLEERIRVQRDPERQQVLRAAARRGAQTRVARAREKGVMPPTSFQKSPELAREARRKSAAVRRALLGDPEYRAWLSERCSEGKCGRIEVACAGCGARFELTRSAARDGERHFCGEPCLRAFRRAWAEELERRRRAKPSPTVELVCRACGGAFRGRVGRLYCSPLCRSRGKRRSREVPLTCRTCGQPFRGDPRREFCSLACHGRSPRPDARAKMRDAARRRGRPHLEELRAMAADAFAGLPDLPRRVVRLYYGLEDGGPRTQREIARMCGVAQVRVQPIVAEAVERLLQSTRS